MSIIEQNNIFLRQVCIDDKDQVLAMRNAPHVRAAMLNNKIITKDEHEAWFLNMLVDPSKDFYILEINGQVSGVVGFFNIDEDEADWTFYLGDENKHKGVGTQMCKMGLDFFFHAHNSNAVVTRIKIDNYPSIKLHKKLGFYKSQALSNDKQQASFYTLEKKGWIALRENLD